MLDKHIKRCYYVIKAHERFLKHKMKGVFKMSNVEKLITQEELVDIEEFTKMFTLLSKEEKEKFLYMISGVLIVSKSTTSHSA